MTEEPATTPGFLSSTTSYQYELDLPPLPGGPTKAHPTNLSLKPKSPVYSNVMRPSGDGPADIPLGVILEVTDRESSSEEEVGSDCEDVTPIYSNAAVERSSELGDNRDNHQYTHLRKSRRNKENQYANPSVESMRQLNSHESSDQDKQRVHETNYVHISDEGTGVTDTPPAHQHRGFHRKEDPWKTLSRRYTQMTKIGMQKSLSISGAKKFCIFLGVLAVLFVIALAGVVLGVTSWNLLDEEAEDINGRLGDYILSLRECRIGRNWSSIDITPDTDYLNITLPINSDTMNISLTDLPVLSKEDMHYRNATQLLLYVILRSNTVPQRNTDDVGSGEGLDDNRMVSSSFVNVALWTRNVDIQRSFRQYMVILNEDTPQIVSKSIWLPLENTNKHLFITAELMDSGIEEIPLHLDVRVYLAGYC